MVPVLDGARSLPALLDALAAQTIAAERYELVVVDNGSRDRSAEIASSRGARVVSEPQRGRARARNRGVEMAKAPLIAFTDADCVPADGWLEAVLDCLEHRSLVAGAVRLLTGDPPNRWERVERLWRFTQERNVERGWAATANLGVWREAFDAVGGFDPNFRRIGEDVDFCLRARAAGHPVGYCGKAVVAHQSEASMGAVVRRGFAHGYSSNQLAHRWPGVWGWRYWRHPRPVLAGDWALRRFGDAALRERDLLGAARAEYAAQAVGSLWAELRRAR